MKGIRYPWGIRGFLLGAAVLLIFALQGPVRFAEAETPAAVKQFQLFATDGYLTLPDGNKVYIWGYSLTNQQGSAVYPSPTLEVNEGDRVEVTLTNIGPLNKGIKKLAHTIHWHGLDTDQQNDGVPHTAAAIQVGESYTYQFTAKHAGTFFYHCHVDTIEHLQMGMHGAFIVKAKDGANQAWTGGPSYDKDYVFVVNEIDPVRHKAVEEGKSYDRTAFHPTYWTINGKAYPDTEKDSSTMIEGKVGQTVLIRIINSGYQSHSFHMHGYHFDVIASDGRPLPQIATKDTILIGPGERYDLLVKFDQDGMFPFHSHNIVDNTNNGVYPGGLHTMMDVTKDSGPGLSKTIVLRSGKKSVTVDGTKVTLQQAPAAIQGYTYLPLRFIAEQWNADVKWDPKQQAATYTTANKTIQIWMNKKQAETDGRLINMAAVPKYLNGKVMVPVRFVSDLLGGKVSYDKNTGEIALTAVVNENATAPPDDNGGHHHDTGTGDTEPAGNADPLTVEIHNGAFVPNKLTIQKGQTVKWINKDTQVHTVYDLNDAFASKNLLSNGVYTYQFSAAGTYTYYCSTHPTMQAEITVTESL